MKYSYIFVLAIAFLTSSVVIMNPFSHGNGNINGLIVETNQTQNQNKTSEIELSGNVTHVADGDTLDINGVRIRLSLVNTPERGQDGFKEAKDFVMSLCLGKKGELDVDNGQRRGDRYGRELGVVYCDGINVNEKLIDNHLANILTQYCDVSEFSTQNWAKPYC